MARGKARTHLGRPQRRVKPRQEPSVGIEYDCEKSIDDLLGQGDNKYAEARLDIYARLAWGSDYTRLLLMEAASNGSMEDVENTMSRYRRGIMSQGGDRAEEEWRRSVLRLSAGSEQRLREANSRYIPLSQALKACAALNDQLPVLAWEAERKGRRLPDKGRPSLPACCGEWSRRALPRRRRPTRMCGSPSSTRRGQLTASSRTPPSSVLARATTRVLTAPRRCESSRLVAPAQGRRATAPWSGSMRRVQR